MKSTVLLLIVFGYSEIIDDFKDMVATHIRTFEKNQKVKPEKLLVFRDGVSEGQYAHVVESVFSETDTLVLTYNVSNELKAIKDAAASFGANYRPKVTFVVCAKRVSFNNSRR